METVTARVLGTIALVLGLAQIIGGVVRIAAGHDVIWGAVSVSFGLVCILAAVLFFRVSRRKNPTGN